MGHIIGIDLGTTFSCVAYLEGQRPLVVSNLEGARTTPSVVSFTTAGDRLVGNLALRQAITNPEHTVFAVKRLIGQKFDAPEIVAARKKAGFEMVAAPNGDVQVRVDDKIITPQEISGIILGYLRQCAEQHFGEPVTEAVITVPAHFNDLQRQATKDAAQIAGLDVLRVINEPTAASLAYGLDTKKNATIAVFDMGGGTFDITLLEIQDGVFQVLATNGDSFLGGEDFDNRIVEWLVEEFWKEQRIDLTQDKLALQRIKEAAERAKRELSFTLESEINLPFICSAQASSLHIKKVLSRSRLEDLTEDLVRKTLPCVEGALEDARLPLAKVDEIILVGGQTRMPLIKKTISDFFRKPPTDNVNPDEIVAVGAAIQSGILGGAIDDLVLLLDVTAFSIGIETENDVFETIIERNTTIPTKVTKSFTTVEHNQRQVRIHVLQGESKEAHENRPLAIFYLMGIEPAPAGVPQIDVSFEIDADGLVRVHARDKVSGSEHRVEVRPSSGLTRSELQTIIEDQQASKAGPKSDGK